MDRLFDDDFRHECSSILTGFYNESEGPHTENDFDSLIMCGGKNERFKEGREPKLLQDVDGLALMDWPASAMIVTGVRNMFFGTGGPHQDDIIDHIKGRYDRFIDVNGLRGIASINGRENAYRTIQNTRYMSFRLHLDRCNNFFTETGHEPFNEIPFERYFRKELPEDEPAEFAAKTAYLMDTQPMMLVSAGDSIHSKASVELTKAGYIPDPLSDVAAKNVAIEEAYAERGEKFFETIRPWGNKPLVHLMPSNRDDQNMLPSMEPVLQVNYGNRIAVEEDEELVKLGFGGDFEPREDRSVGLSVIDPSPYDYKITGFGAADEGFRSLNIRPMTFKGFLWSFYDLHETNPSYSEMGMEEGDRRGDSSLYVMESFLPFIDVNTEDDLEMANEMDVSRFVKSEGSESLVDGFRNAVRNSRPYRERMFASRGFVKNILGEEMDNIGPEDILQRPLRLDEIPRRETYTRQTRLDRYSDE